MARRVEFAYPREVGGKKYRQDEAAEFEDGVAAQLIADGFARPATDKQGAKPGSKED